MREFIGHKLKVGTKTFGLVEGLLTDESPEMILLKGSDGLISRIMKHDIGGFMPIDFEPKPYIPFHVLFCKNARTCCPGVQYVKEGEGFSRNDIDMFVNPCPCRSDDCSVGTKGELRSVSGSVLQEMLSGTMFGEYPENPADTKPEEEKDGKDGKDGKERGSECQAADGETSKG